VPVVLRRLRWWVAHLLVIGLCVTFVNLGFWQLRRLDERRLENLVQANRFAAEPVPLGVLLQSTGSDLESIEYRRVTVAGSWQPDHEVLVRSQVLRGAAGYHVITPLLLATGTAVLVNRGWIPLETKPPLPAAGEQEVSGWVRLTQVRAGAGPLDPPGQTLRQVARVDIDRLSQQMPWPLLPVYVVGQTSTGDALPVPVSPPDLTDEGPHFWYALQWFSFTVIGVVGYSALLWRATRRGRGRASQVSDDLDPA
jgi:surfeit locus 1 family protein